MMGESGRRSSDSYIKAGDPCFISNDTQDVMHLQWKDVGNLVTDTSKLVIPTLFRLPHRMSYTYSGKMSAPRNHLRMGFHGWGVRATYPIRTDDR